MPRHPRHPVKFAIDGVPAAQRAAIRAGRASERVKQADLQLAFADRVGLLVHIAEL
jgi:hypothetical protein